MQLERRGRNSGFSAAVYSSSLAPRTRVATMPNSGEELAFSRLGPVSMRAPLPKNTKKPLQSVVFT